MKDEPKSRQAHNNKTTTQSLNSNHKIDFEHSKFYEHDPDYPSAPQIISLVCRQTKWASDNDRIYNKYAQFYGQ